MRILRMEGGFAAPVVPVTCAVLFRAVLKGTGNAACIFVLDGKCKLASIAKAYLLRASSYKTTATRRLVRYTA